MTQMRSELIIRNVFALAHFFLTTITLIHHRQRRCLREAQTPMSKGENWYVYVLVSESSGRTYVGSTNDPIRRIAQHNGLKPGGAKNTLAHRPWKIGAIYGTYANRSEAFKAEKQLKKSKRGQNRLSWEGGSKIDESVFKMGSNEQTQQTTDFIEHDTGGRT